MTAIHCLPRPSFFNSPLKRLGGAVLGWRGAHWRSAFFFLRCGPGRCRRLTRCAGCARRRGQRDSLRLLQSHRNARVAAAGWVDESQGALRANAGVRKWAAQGAMDECLSLSRSDHTPPPLAPQGAATRHGRCHWTMHLRLHRLQAPICRGHEPNCARTSQTGPYLLPYLTFTTPPPMPTDFSSPSLL